MNDTAPPGVEPPSGADPGAVAPAVPREPSLVDALIPVFTLVGLMATTIMPVRAGRDRGTAPGLADAQRRGGRADRGEERLHDELHPRRCDQRRFVGHDRAVHPARRRGADRHLEHVRDDRRHRLLRPVDPERHVVLRRDDDPVRARRGGVRQLVDHRRHRRGGARRPCPAARAHRRSSPQAP